MVARATHMSNEGIDDGDGLMIAISPSAGESHCSIDWRLRYCRQLARVIALFLPHRRYESADALDAWGSSRMMRNRKIVGGHLDDHGIGAKASAGERCGHLYPKWGHGSWLMDMDGGKAKAR